ncbi:Glycosyl transferase [Cinnamomum micranthum f. kanehirae]|uniref:Glycosyl transferase n=1 Tax=Cinnamomum micranthum f. kanehirae TaxID=337451 RepID=A0A443Q2N7_9MAGN|nr:Glycosyl transferase [Cinnamomum micranthum f. kanehirae]
MGKNPMGEITASADDVVDLGIHAVRGSTGFPIKRNPHPENPRGPGAGGDGDRRSDRQARSRSRLFRGGRNGLPLPVRGFYLFYAVFAVVAVGFLICGSLLQDSLSAVFRVNGDGAKAVGRQGEISIGNTLRFLPHRLQGGGQADQLSAPRRFAVRAPRLALILGSLKKDPTTLKLLTVVKNLQGLGYMFTIYAMEDGEAHSLWKLIGGHLSVLDSESADHVDWSMFEGIVLCSIEAKRSMLSLMKEPFSFIPLIWIIQEDTLGKRLAIYAEMGWEHLISEWRNAFSRADVVVFPDFSLPMLYSTLDTGNFFVVSGSPVDVWSAESYIKSHSKYQLRKQYGFRENDLLVLVVGSSFFYNELPWDFAVAMQAARPLLKKFTGANHLEESFKFIFLCGNSTDSYREALQEIASHLGFPDDSIKHYSMDNDVNSVLLMADVVLYGSFKDEQGFPSLLIRSMSFEIPIIAPDLTVIKKYIVNGVHGVIFQSRNPDSLTRAFSLLIPNMKLSKVARAIASSGKLLARNILASDCITGYAKLLENILQFPSDTKLPGSISPLQQYKWEWDLLRKERKGGDSQVIQSLEKIGSSMTKSSVVYALEEEFSSTNYMRNTSENEIDILTQENLSKVDWDDVREMEMSEEFERREIQELEERMEKTLGSWEEIYRNARKAEKLKFETNERDEGELERVGQSLCIYEIYNGAGAWPFLQHGSLYRGLSLSTRERRSTSDDVDAVGRLSLLNDTYYRDRLCEIGGMFSIANQVDNIHKIPWIGFQSWRAAGRKVSLSSKAERVLEDTIAVETVGDVIYYWARTGMDSKARTINSNVDFWSLCDILNGGFCREAFENSFRQMYGLPEGMATLPPMPDDGHHWSMLHSWAMPTPSFLEYVMFSRMFVDSLDSISHNSNNSTCPLGSSKLEEKHCYCRLLELLVNVWAYHSARKMVYIDPISGSLREQHPVELRKGVMWVKYFNFTLLKSMDEDLAEEADDSDHPSERWLWPLTGEVHWKGIYEREREERYRRKMEKKRKEQEKLLERQRYGYKQKPLGNR